MNFSLQIYWIYGFVKLLKLIIIYKIYECYSTLILYVYEFIMPVFAVIMYGPAYF